MRDGHHRARGRNAPDLSAPCAEPLEAADELRGFFAVAHTKDLVGSAQVLLHRRLGEEEALCNLGVAKSLGDELQDLPLAGGKRVEISGILVRYEVLKELPRGDDLAPGGHFHGAGYLIQLHTGMYEAPSPEPQGGTGERQIHVQAEDQNRDLRVDLPDAFYALRESPDATRVEYGRGRSNGIRRGCLSQVHPRPPLQSALEACGYNRVRTIYPDKPKRLTFAAY